MSGEATPQSESGSQTTAQAPKADKKPRSPVERVIVWGGITVLLLLVAVQAHARFGYKMTLNNLQPLVDDDYEGGQPLALAEVDNHVVGFPSQSENSIDGKTTERVYRWHGLGRSYGITLSYNPGADPVVITGLATDNPPPPPALPETDESDAEEFEDPTTGMPGGPPRQDAEGPGGGGPGGRGPGGGGPGGGGPGSGGQFNPMDNDANGDGVLTPEEVPERWRENFAERDTNNDGVLDASEIEAMREQFRRRREEGGGEGGEGRPPRPSREGADESPAPDTPPAGDSDSGTASDESPDNASEESGTETP